MKNLLFLAIFMIMVVTACGPQKEANSTDIHTLMRDYPQVEQALKNIPEEDLERIIVPKYIPFEVQSVEAIVYPGKKKEVELIFSNGSLNLHVMNGEFSGSKIPSNTKIHGERSALYNTNKFGKVLEWPDKQHNGYYTIKLMTYTPEKELPYTKQDLLKVANSMYNDQNVSM
ncbi:hypothetical protein [Pontibacillus marinus]|uniref:DUF4367 domain-containing protein n=1 Tax=Pontibacillus marinus BH030004 = DSM 16465 TaxID=1385511 RepID=A0A0A5HQB8_9BACI|nr:hypothetical protein [Pontibacillus marinus]KGX85822.1 hypothetical protein N783_13745 [Pontibacillus marinus BH030004 = DSM 16465]